MSDPVIRHQMPPRPLAMDVDTVPSSMFKMRVLNCILRHAKTIWSAGVESRWSDKYSDSKDDLVGVTASTGLAACAFGGTAVHAWAGLGIMKGAVEQLFDQLKKRSGSKERWQKTRVLIVDESMWLEGTQRSVLIVLPVSMMDGAVFDKMEELACRIRRSNKPFGGIQLPPVGANAKPTFKAMTWATVVEVKFNLMQRSGQWGLVRPQKQHRSISNRVLTAIEAVLSPISLLLPFAKGIRHQEPARVIPPPDLFRESDAIEEGERINAFWAVFMLQKNLAVALEPPARICGMLEAGGIQIDTPWPLELDEYKKASLTSNVQGDSTVRNYLSQQAPSYQERTSLIAMNVKACILLSQAVYLNGQHIPRGETQSWWAAFHAVDRLINALRSQLPDLAQLDDRTARTVLLTQSLLNAATIKVHSLYMREDQRSRHTCLAAACDMFRFGEKRLHGLGYLNHLNPMMGTLWLTACCVLVDEIKRPRPPSQTLSYDEKEVNASLLDGLATLKAFARGSLLMRKMLLAQ
ncbi:hypothetical protein B0H10DRAFT_1963613 [Mycena sp. CBHHK59/15]|nr:hypothetical protein B0H10DRAFT_1963613 [Mycena sp. CBHHK59/15]